MISKKAIIAGVFSAIVGIGMLAMPVKAMAHDGDHDGGGRYEHHDNGRHNGWYKHHGGDDDDNWTSRQGWGSGYRQEPDADDYGYGGGYRNYGYGGGYPYRNGRGYLPENGQGMVSRRHPGLVWTCDSDGHHCQWSKRYGSNYGYPRTGVNPLGGLFGNGGNGYYGNNGSNGQNGYGNGYYGNSGYGNGYYGNSSPLGGLGSLLGIMP